MANLTIKELKTMITTIEWKIKELNEMKTMLKEAYLYCYLDLDTQSEIKKITDKVKEKAANL